MPTPLTPDIRVEPSPSSLGVCCCCDVETRDGSVKHVKFTWRDGKKLSGGTAVALCRECRVTAIAAMAKSLL